VPALTPPVERRTEELSPGPAFFNRPHRSHTCRASFQCRLSGCRRFPHRVQSRRCNCLVAVGGITDIGMRWSPEGSVARDPERTSPTATTRKAAVSQMVWTRRCRARSLPTSLIGSVSTCRSGPVPSVRLRRGKSKKPREDILPAARSPKLIGYCQRLPANSVVFALDRNVCNLAVVTFQDGQQSLVTAIDRVTEACRLCRQRRSDRSRGPV
jgi:hypothetical protein